MRWSLCKRAWKFALVPHQCHRCEEFLWLEKYFKNRGSYGGVDNYCKDCAIVVFPDLKKDIE